MVNNNLVGGFDTYPSEKYESQLGLWNSQYMENNVAKHQPEDVEFHEENIAFSHNS